MRILAWWCARRAVPEALEWTALETPAPGPGEVRVEQHAIGVNFIDTYFRSGLYPWPTTPLIPGGEAAGIVDAVGEGVSDFKIGDRVAYMLPSGAYRTRARRCRRSSGHIPEAVDFDVAASVMLKGTDRAISADFLLRGQSGRYGAGACGRRRGGAAAGSVAEGPGRDCHRHGGLAEKAGHGKIQRLCARHRLSRRGFRRRGSRRSPAARAAMWSTIRWATTPGADRSNV